MRCKITALVSDGCGGVTVTLVPAGRGDVFKMWFSVEDAGGYSVGDAVSVTLELE